MSSVKRNFKLYKPSYATNSSLESSSKTIYYDLSSDVTQFNLPSTSVNGYTVVVRSIYNNVEVVAPKGTTIVGQSDGIIKTFVYDATNKTYVIDSTNNYSFYLTRELVKLSSDNIVGTSVYQGYSVALSADGLTLAVGSPNDNEQDTNYGATYIYRYNVVSGSWTEQVKLMSSNASGSEVKQGYSVALSADGNTLAVGSPQDGGQVVDGIDYIGAAYVYKYNASSGSWEETKLFVNDVTYDASTPFTVGHSVALSTDGNTLVVGAPSIYNFTLYTNGRVYIYKYNASTASWDEQSIIIDGLSSLSLSSGFGWSVALSDDGNTLGVGVINIGGKGGCCIYKYNTTSSTWEFQHLLRDNNANDSGYQGCSVSLSSDGNVCAVGAFADSELGSDRGAVYNYRYLASNNTWSMIKLLSSANTSYLQQGYSVDLSGDGNTLAVGAPGGNNVIIYKYNTKTNYWEEKILLSDVVQDVLNGADFGKSIALSYNGNVLAVGTPLEGDDDSGATYIFI